MEYLLCSGPWVYEIQMHNQYGAKLRHSQVMTWKCSQTQKPSNQVTTKSNFRPSMTLLKRESKITHC